MPFKAKFVLRYLMNSFHIYVRFKFNSPIMILLAALRLDVNAYGIDAGADSGRGLNVKYYICR